MVTFASLRASMTGWSVVHSHRQWSRRIVPKRTIGIRWLYQQEQADQYTI